MVYFSHTGGGAELKVRHSPEGKHFYIQFVVSLFIFLFFFTFLYGWAHRVYSCFTSCVIAWACRLLLVHTVNTGVSNDTKGGGVWFRPNRFEVLLFVQVGPTDETPNETEPEWIGIIFTSVCFYFNVSVAAVNHVTRGRPCPHRCRNFSESILASRPHPNTAWGHTTWERNGF